MVKTKVLSACLISFCLSTVPAMDVGMSRFHCKKSSPPVILTNSRLQEKTLQTIALAADMHSPEKPSDHMARILKGEANRDCTGPRLFLLLLLHHLHFRPQPKPKPLLQHDVVGCQRMGSSLFVAQNLLP